MFEIIRRQQQRHRELFGCDPGKRYAVFFQLASNEDPSSLERKMLEVMLHTDVDDCLIYASTVTGRMVTEHNRKFLDEDELDEWNEAFDEAELLQEQGHDLRAVLLHMVFPERFCVGATLVDDQISAVGLILAHGVSPRAVSGVKACGLSLLSQAMQCARLFRTAADQQYYPELVTFARTIFEIAVRIERLERDPGVVEMLEAQSGLLAVEYAYARRPNGKLDSRTAVHSVSGKKVDIGRSNLSLCDGSSFGGLTDIYMELFPLLSAVIHPNGTYASARTLRRTESKNTIEDFEIGYLALNTTLNHLLAAAVASKMLARRTSASIKFFCHASTDKVRTICREYAKLSDAEIISACARLTEATDRYLISAKI